jgi:hypothetical protein
MIKAILLMMFFGVASVTFCVSVGRKRYDRLIDSGTGECRDQDPGEPVTFRRKVHPQVTGAGVAPVVFQR